MTARNRHDETSKVSPTLAARMRSWGVPFLSCSEDGHVGQDVCERDDWVSQLCATPMVADAARKGIREWSQQSDPAPLRVVEGFWLVPVPRRSRRGMESLAVAVFLTDRFAGSDGFDAIIDEAGLTPSRVRRELKAMVPIPESEVSRIGDIIRAIDDDWQTRQRAQLDVEHVGKQLAESYEEMNLLYTIIQQMTDVQQPERFIRIACRELLATLPYAWIGVQFSRSDAVISTLSGRFVRAGESASSWESIRRLVRLVMRRTKAGEPWVIESSVSRENAIFESLGRAVLVQPLSRNGEVVGVMVAGDKQGRDTEASSIDMKLLGATAQHVSIFLDNAALYSDLNAMFVGTLEALTASIDAKDPYTCGHSLRVAHLTRQLAEAAEYEPDEVGTARIAGLVHDVGKIGVPEQVLSKPGKLNEEEFAWIRRHPEIGHRILKDIPKFTAILPGVLYHHERWDGKGYPEGLSGTEIPPVARMIALADAFDAMSSTRTYRKAMTRSDVLSEIERCAGSQFDPQLAALFLQLDLGEFDRLLAEHRNMQADGSEFAA